MKKQNGLGVLSGMLTLVVVVLVGLSLLRLAPAYVDNYAVGQALKNAAENVKVTQGDSDPMIIENYKTSLFKQFRIDSVTTATPDDLKVVREDGQVKVKLNYDVQLHMIANIDALIHFNDEAQVKMQ